MGDNPAMNWNFTKMHGAGNDFVVLDGVRQTIEMTPERARAGRPAFGVGADQILLVERATRPDADFRYRIFNADGSEVEHCGNGARCFVRFVHEQGLSDKNPLRAEISTGILVLDEGDDEQVTVDMGSTRFEPSALPFDTAGLASRQQGQDTLWALELDAPPACPLGRGIGGGHFQPARGAGGGRRGRLPRRRDRPAGRDARALSAPGQRRFHAGRGPQQHPPARP